MENGTKELLHRNYAKPHLMKSAWIGRSRKVLFFLSMGLSGCCVAWYPGAWFQKSWDDTEPKATDAWCSSLTQAYLDGIRRHWEVFSTELEKIGIHILQHQIEFGFFPAMKHFIKSMLRRNSTEQCLDGCWLFWWKRFPSKHWLAHLHHQRWT